MASDLLHGREGVLMVSTDSESTGGDSGDIVGYVNSWGLDPTKDLPEITSINRNSKVFIEGLVGATLNATGNFRVNDTVVKSMINRFADVHNHTSTGGDSETVISDEDLYFHLLVKPIDTDATSDNKKGAKFYGKAKATGFSIAVEGGSPETWTYNGTVSGDLEYHESTSTDDGIPAKSNIR